MRLQENTLFDLDPNVKVPQYFTQFPIHHVIYAPAKFAVASINGLGGDALTRNVMDRPMHAHTEGRWTGLLKINVLGGNAFTRKYII